MKLYKEKYPKYILLFSIVAVWLYTIFFTYVLNAKSDGYILGDWLINYQDGGFKRRGLSGSFFFLLQDVTHLPLHILVYITQFAIITSFFVLFYKIVKDKNVSWLYLSLVLSALAFVGLLNSVDYAGKKEFILFVIFAYFVYTFDRDKLTKKKEFIICIILAIGVLFHEIILFFVPYFAIIHYLKYKGKPLYYLKYFVAVGVPAAAIILFGKSINEGHSIEILKSRGVDIHNGIFFWDIDEHAILVQRFRNVFMYSIGFVLSALHVWLYTKSELTGRKVGLLLGLSFLYSLPLFYLGLDWGRWWYIHMMMVVILCGQLLSSANVRFNSESMKIIDYCAMLIIFASMLYRVELSGLFTFEGLFYRVFVAPVELYHKVF